MSIVLELPDDLTADVSARAQRAGKTRDDFIVEVLRRQIAMEEFREARTRLVSYGKAAGLETDESVFSAIS